MLHTSIPGSQIRVTFALFFSLEVNVKINKWLEYRHLFATRIATPTVVHYAGCGIAIGRHIIIM